MKKIQTIIVASVLVMGMVFCGPAFAGSQGKGDRRGFAVSQRHKGGGLMLLARYQQINLVVQVLSEMTGQETEAISTKLKQQRMPTVMQELDIDLEEFRAKIQAEVRNRVEQAAKNGTITAAQEQEILTNMENRSKRREVMQQLIEKGIEDGTITQEQAQMLRPKRR